MRLFRIALLLMLSVILPIYGWASIAVVSPCPMQAAPSPMKSSAICCEGSDHAKSGNACKSGFECQAGSLYQSTAAIIAPAIAQSNLVIPTLKIQIAVNTPASVWRPPRQL
jgi:hypothetical protein